jgi:hypothetical protein
MSASVSRGEGLSIGATRAVFPVEDPNYAIFPDGERFAAVESIPDAQAAPTIRVIQNWYEEFRDGKQAPR